MPSLNPTHVPSAEVIAKETQVLELRRAGMSFDAIATQVGLADRGSAHKAYKRGLARTLQQPAAEVRELEADRLDRLQVAVWAKALRGDLQAVDRVLRISERRARLLGLDHADGIAEQALLLEQDKARMVAVAVGEALDAIDATAEQREIFTRVLLERMRVADAAGVDEQPETVPGEVAR